MICVYVVRGTFATMLLATSVLFAASLPLSADDEEGEITLEKIAARAAQWRASFVNLRVVYDSRSLPPTDEPVVDWPLPPTDPDSAPRFSQNEWIWADHGLDLLDDKSFYWTPGKVGYRTIDVFNVSTGVAFRASYQKSREDVEELKELQIQGTGVGKPTSWKNRVALEGLYWPNKVEWLPDVLAKLEWKLEGIEPVLGQRCARISTQYQVGQQSRVEILWLDLKHDCLPRRYRSPPTPTRKIGTDFVVDELQQLQGGLWFPKQARLQLQTTPIQNQLIVVTDAEINLSLDLTRFDPPTPVTGTVVTDGRTDKVYTHGQQTTSQEQASKVNPTAAVTQPPSAVPPTLRVTGWVIAIICASFALMAIGFWLQKKE